MKTAALEDEIKLFRFRGTRLIFFSIRLLSFCLSHQP